MTTVSSPTAAQLGALSAAQINALSATTLSGLGSSQVQALGASQLNGVSASTFQSFNAANFSKGQISSLTTALVNLSVAQAGELSAAQVGDLSAAQVGQLSGKTLSALGTPEVAALTTAQVQGISTGAVAQLSVTTLNALNATQLGALSKTQVQALTGAQVSGLSNNALNALNVSYLSSAQVGSLTASQVAGVTTANFQKAVAPNLASLSAAGRSGLTQAQVASLTTAQVSGLSTSSLTGTAKSYASDFDAVLSSAQNDLSGGALGFSGAQSLLTSATQGGLSAGKFAALQAFAGELDAKTGTSVAATASVKQLFDDVVLGTTGNAFYTGGGSKSVALGNLTATSSQTQASELVGKWFLGNDDPSLTGTQATGYAAQTGPLFSAAGPQATDVNQGTAGDCYFLAALSSEASQSPDAIKNLVSSDGNGVYTVDFKLNGADDFVTVNNGQATLPKGYQVGSGSNLAFDDGGSSVSTWTEVVEKAYVEFRGDTDASSNSSADPQNSYAHVNGGWDQGIAALTGGGVTDYAAGSYATANAQKSLANTLQSAVSARDVLTLSTGASDDAALGLYGDHMYSVLSVNAANGTVTLDNPWNANSPSGSGKETESIAALLAQGVTFHASSGALVA